MNKSVLNEFELLFTNYPQLLVCKESIKTAYELMSKCYRDGGLIMTCGNGGSAADADHIVGELMKGFKLKRPLTPEQKQLIGVAFPEDETFLTSHLQQAIPAISLVSQSALATAFINDVHPEMAFAQQVWGYGKPGDVLIGLSTSGNSKNVVNACKIAKAIEMKTVGFTGEKASSLSKICDITVQVPAHQVFRIQEYHLPVYHTLCSMLEMEAFDKY